MILTALTNYYGRLVEKGILPEEGWSDSKVDFALNIGDDGQLLSVSDLREEDPNGKNKKKISMKLQLPNPVRRSGKNFISNFLWDNSTYLLGIGKEEDEQKIKKDLNAKFQACREKHHQILGESKDPCIKAVLGFFDSWDSSNTSAIPDEYKKDIRNNANLTFRYKGKFVSQYSSIRDAYQLFLDSIGGDTGVCLVTGKKLVLAKTHLAVKGAGGQSSGTALVSFNMDSACSFGKKQGANAPTSSYAATAYPLVLNYLIEDWKHCQRIADTVVVFWAEDGETKYQDIFSSFFGTNDDNTISDDELSGIMNKLCKGESVEWDNVRLNPDNRFYILGMYPNNARLSIRFFYYDSFGNIMKNVQQHFEDIEIIHSKAGKRYLSPYNLIVQTALKNEKDRVKPQLSGDLLRAIIGGIPYPSTLYNGVMIRLRARDELNREKAAIIKGYLIRKPQGIDKEVLTVELNENSNYLPYVLGRMFSILESIQERANPGINTTIKDKYFNSAAATPAIVFPRLISLSQNHLKKMKNSQKVYYDKLLIDLCSKVGESYPARMTLQEQGVFQLGYYHQRQKKFEKKDKKEE